MDEKLQDILQKTVPLFMRFGIRSMTMDDVARQLGMSKKTLYQFVTDKNDLVKKVMHLVVEGEKETAQCHMAEHSNAIDMLFALTKSLAQKYTQVHPSINYDLEKYHPDAWAVFQDFKQLFITGCVEANLKQGMEQGLYRTDLDPYLIARFYAAKIDLCTDGQSLPPDKYSFASIHLEMMRYHLRGIASEKGLLYIQQRENCENENAQ